METLLDIGGLDVAYRQPDGNDMRVLSQVRFGMAAGEGVGVLGESGCGKTTLALAIPRLLPRTARLESGAVLFRGRDLLRLSDREMEAVRGAQIAAIFQEPGIALNPVLRVGEQVADVVRVHRGGSRAKCRAEAEAALSLVQLADTRRIYSAFAHQLSGGQRQRVLIAMALACRPALLIADEPTALLDATVQAEILDLLKELKRQLGMAVLLISHNPAVLARIADRVLVMYAGRIVEEASATKIFAEPLHPYTRGLLESLPPAPDRPARRRLTAIPGAPPDPAHAATGCRFEPRCADRMEHCTQREPDEMETEPGRRVCCFKYGG